jgi:hypothetical protein
MPVILFICGKKQFINWKFQGDHKMKTPRALGRVSTKWISNVSKKNSGFITETDRGGISETL